MSDPKNEEAIFRNAIEIKDVEERRRYIRRACCEDAELLTQVMGLISAHEDGSQFLERPALAETISPVSGGDRSFPERIGRYQLLQKIGEGGFGIVYMAQQHEPIRRRVALKVLKAGMDTIQVVGRFEAERQALAMMNHPHIAKVFDAGSTEQGRPYFAMELVKGVPITQFCDEHKLSSRDRLQLFVKVCRAVQHAHQRGIIHRDIKPSNVLIALEDDGEPNPKIIDFGISKALQEPLTDRTVFTEFMQVIGTPIYMSPEQATLSGADIDTRSDVYALGVLLYELLTGVPPFSASELKKAAFDEMLRIIREEIPPTPSRKLSTMGKRLATVAESRGARPDKLYRLVRGDLEWIVMKALEKDRARRFQMPNTLADDIERFLTNQPVSARKPSISYRLTKALQRNKTLALAIVGAVLLVVITLQLADVLRSWQAERLIAEQGALLITTDGDSFGAELMDLQAANVIEQLGIPMQEPLQVAPGDYRIRVRIPNVPEIFFPLTIFKGELNQQHIARPNPKWPPIELSSEDEFELVRFGDREDVLVLGEKVIRRLRGDTGEVIWSTNYETLPKLTKYGGRNQFSDMDVYLPAADLDQDGVADVLLYSTYFDAYAFSGRTGTHLWDCHVEDAIPTVELRGAWAGYGGYGVFPEREKEQRRPMLAIQMEKSQRKGAANVLFFYASKEHPNRSRGVQWKTACMSGATGKLLWEREADRLAAKPANWRSLAYTGGEGRAGERNWSEREEDSATEFVTAQSVYRADLNGDTTLDFFWVERIGVDSPYLLHRSPLRKVAWRRPGLLQPVADFNNDGIVDLVDHRYRPVAVSGRDGMRLWNAVDVLQESTHTTMQLTRQGEWRRLPSGVTEINNIFSCGDLNGDGTLDWVTSGVNTSFPRGVGVSAYCGQTGAHLWYCPVVEAEDAKPVSIHCVDVDGHQEVALLFDRRKKRYLTLITDGTVCWERTFPGLIGDWATAPYMSNRLSLSVSDFNGDGDLEFLAAVPGDDARSESLCLMDMSGKQLWNRQIGIGVIAVSTNLDTDNKKELFVVRGGMIELLSAVDGTSLYRRQAGSSLYRSRDYAWQRTAPCTPIVTNLGDGGQEVFCALDLEGPGKSQLKPLVVSGADLVTIPLPAHDSATVLDAVALTTSQPLNRDVACLLGCGDDSTVLVKYDIQRRKAAWNWSVPADGADTPSITDVVPASHGSGERIVVMTRNVAYGVDAETGTLAWKVGSTDQKLLHAGYPSSSAVPVRKRAPLGRGDNGVLRFMEYDERADVTLSIEVKQ